MEHIETVDQMEQEETQEFEQQIVLTKKNGVWQMDCYKEGKVFVTEGKELVIALVDLENPIAQTIVDGPVLGFQSKSLYVKYSSTEDVKQHDCFVGKKKDILNVLNNEGVILALSPHEIPMTKKYQAYLKKNNIQINNLVKE